MGTVELRLEIEFDSEPITGSLIVAGHVPRPFVGWVELTEAIEHVKSGLSAIPAPGAPTLRTALP